MDTTTDRLVATKQRIEDLRDQLAEETATLHELVRELVAAGAGPTRIQTLLGMQSVGSASALIRRAVDGRWRKTAAPASRPVFGSSPVLPADYLSPDYVERLENRGTPADIVRAVSGH